LSVRRYHHTQIKEYEFDFFNNRGAEYQNIMSFLIPVRYIIVEQARLKVEQARLKVEQARLEVAKRSRLKRIYVNRARLKEIRVEQYCLQETIAEQDRLEKIVAEQDCLKEIIALYDLLRETITKRALLRETRPDQAYSEGIRAELYRVEEIIAERDRLKEIIAEQDRLKKFIAEQYRLQESTRTVIQCKSLEEDLYYDLPEDYRRRLRIGSLVWSQKVSEIKKTKNLRSARVVTSTVGKINPANKRHYEVPGNLNGARVMAFPDTGAEKNVISLDFAVRNKLDIQCNSQLKFQLPTGKVSRSVGTAYLPWQFFNEPRVFKILFSVLPECTHDVIIGGKFLKFTQTLTKFAHRIKMKLLPFPPRLGVKLLGSQRQRVWGSLDGERAVAVPDTGSDVMLVSTAYAMQRGFKISDQKDYQLELEFADGSRAFTRGLVKGVDWSFDDSDTSYQCDFHVLDNLPVDVVLSNDFLFGVNAFSEYASSFFDADDVSAQGYVELSLVRQISWLSNRIQKIFGRKTQEGTYRILGCLTLDILLIYMFL
jgi:Aspartyl protease